MLSTPKHHEIDHHTIKLIVGVIAVSLASVTGLLTENNITSVSASYHAGGWARDYFVGSLFAIFAFLLAYNGYSRIEMILSKVAAIAALGVAMFPCQCESHQEIVPAVHGVCAAVMFLILAIFCYLFRQRAQAKPNDEAKRRSFIYSCCGIAIVISIVVLGIDSLSGGAISSGFERLTYFGEMVGLVSFGIAWLAASRVFPMITHADERFHPFG
ncbi:MAG: DUF998 domain-containing protein [Planctomycetales bacterium]|nr:DUF998 domain-containing protein [Planctomycetales bacterium]